VVDGSAAKEQSWWSRTRARMARHRALALARKVLVLLVGGSVLLAGLVMFVTPGPGWLALIAGLAILATEFTWAERLLQGAKRRAKAAKDKALDPQSRRENLVIGVLVAACLLLAALWWVEINGVPAPLGAAWGWLRSAVDWRS
jgi:uncharacterized protein (TIGR02611 family)